MLVQVKLKFPLSQVNFAISIWTVHAVFMAMMQKRFATVF